LVVPRIGGFQRVHVAPRTFASDLHQDGLIAVHAGDQLREAHNMYVTTVPTVCRLTAPGACQYLSTAGHGVAFLSCQSKSARVVVGFSGYTADDTILGLAADDAMTQCDSASPRPCVADASVWGLIQRKSHVWTVRAECTSSWRWEPWRLRGYRGKPGVGSAAKRD
jgi:hypothetical protein